ncbi:hypothetical protein NliqN6_6450 [Naganishia liquefaciens]|uniref:CENP-V/GFA domain-containing protein n=1 Tax=Naganishia liquefaciens TaxID=104408 RepID=A0A8H3U085_9TREE|nr:hypothetical protein NliqN6_6450 [Naganishia liquefaciens]
MPADKPDQPDVHAERKARPPYALSEEKQKDGFKAKYTGKCYCGNVTFEVDSDPLDATYCHCRTCQHLHGAPYQWAAILHKDTVHIKTGYDDLHFYSPQHKKMEYVLPCKVSCGLCQSVIMDEGRNMVLLMPTLVDGMGEKGPLEKNGPFRASHHMFYKTAVERVEDHLPKFGGKKGEDPMNEAAEEMAKDVEKKKKEKEEKQAKEERESKRQKTEDQKKDD